MRKCRYASASIPDRIGAFFVYPLAALLVLAADMYFIFLFFTNLFCIGAVKFVGYVGLAAVIAATSGVLYFLGRLCCVTFRMERRLFSLSAEGIELGYSNEKTRFYTWDRIEEIGISAFQASASRQSYETVICVFLKPKPDDFVQGILRLSYGLKNMEQFALIDYSEEIVAQLKAVYHKPITDYRPQQIR